MAAWVLRDLPYSAGFHVLGVAAAQLSALASGDASAATSTGPHESSAGDGSAGLAALEQGLGALTLPVVMASARALLLVSKVLSLPADRSKWERAERTEDSHLLVEKSLEGHWSLRGRIQDQLANTHPSAFSPVAALESCTRAVQLISRLLPHLPPVQLKHKGDASAAEGSAAPAPSQAAPALLPGVLQKLQQQAADCVAALQDATSGLAAASGPGSMSSQGSGNKLVQLLTALAAPSPGDADTPVTERSSAGGADSGSTVSVSKVTKVLEMLALSVLSSLPSARVCGNPDCVELGKMSERELCVRQCSACKGSAPTAHCSKEFSQAHWRDHKPLCRRLAGGKQGRRKAGMAGDDSGGGGSSSPAVPTTDGAAAAAAPASKKGGKGGSKKERTDSLARRAPRPGAILWV